jgi:hypothetical protein
MAPDDDPPTCPRSPATYRLEIRGPLPTALADNLEGFTVSPGPTTTLTGAISDTAALYGLIARLEALGLTQVCVQPVDGGSPRRPGDLH